MTQGDDDRIQRKAYEIWESEGRPHGRHDEHWSRAHAALKQEPSAATPSPDTPASSLHTQDKAMIPGNSAESLSRTTRPEPGSEPTPSAKRPRTQRKKTPAT